MRSDSASLYVRSTTPVVAVELAGHSSSSPPKRRRRRRSRPSPPRGRRPPKSTHGDRDEDQLGVCQLPHQRRRQLGRRAEHDDQVGFAVGGVVQRRRHRRLVDLGGRDRAGSSPRRTAGGRRRTDRRSPSRPSTSRCHAVAARPCSWPGSYDADGEPRHAGRGGDARRARRPVRSTARRPTGRPTR